MNAKVAANKKRASLIENRIDKTNVANEFLIYLPIYTGPISYREYYKANNIENHINSLNI